MDERRVTIPGGRATVVDETAVEVGRPDEAIVVQLLDATDGPRVRIGYRRTGRTVRGPVTATADELERLVDAISRSPALRTLFGVAGGGSTGNGTSRR